MSDIYGAALNAPQQPQGRSFWDVAQQTWPVRLAQQMWGAAKLPGDVYQGNVPVTGPDGYTNPEVINRSADLAGLMTMGATASPAETNAVGMGIRAYHGSPYDFDKFDLSKIGTGEGAQAYGHGLYFAENPNVAASYRNLAPPPSGPIPQEVIQSLRQLDWLGFDTTGQAINAIRTNPDWVSRWDANHPEFAAPVETINKYLEANPRGRMYEVNINADPQQFLDWDKPLSHQADNVKSALRSVGVDVSDPALADKIAAAQGLRLHPPQPSQGLPVSLPGIKSPAASQALYSQGVPGIKYLDQGSRYAGDGSRNYVVFNPQIIDILKKYGIAGLGLTGAGLGLPAPHIQSQ